LPAVRPRRSSRKRSRSTIAVSRYGQRCSVSASPARRSDQARGAPPSVAVSTFAEPMAGLIVSDGCITGIRRARARQHRTRRGARVRALPCPVRRVPVARARRKPVTLVDDLRAALPAAALVTDADLSAWEVDSRKRFRGRARCVVRPGSADEVATIVRTCARHGASLVAQGGNTGLVGGSVPDASGTQVVLSLARLNRVRHVDAANLALTAEAGCV